MARAALQVVSRLVHSKQVRCVARIARPRFARTVMMRLVTFVACHYPLFRAWLVTCAALDGSVRVVRQLHFTRALEVVPLHVHGEVGTRP